MPDREPEGQRRRLVVPTCEPTVRSLSQQEGHCYATAHELAKMVWNDVAHRFHPQSIRRAFKREAKRSPELLEYRRVRPGRVYRRKRGPLDNNRSTNGTTWIRYRSETERRAERWKYKQEKRRARAEERKRLRQEKAAAQVTRDRELAKARRQKREQEHAASKEPFGLGLLAQIHERAEQATEGLLGVEGALVLREARASEHATQRELFVAPEERRAFMQGDLFKRGAAHAEHARAVGPHLSREEQLHRLSELVEEEKKGKPP